ncbi:MAG: hypothetical protein CMK59_09700 [Proteobacteria bacterium]|nr:hypothetical protein [Pseudomonadota bacterium]
MKWTQSILFARVAFIEQELQSMFNLLIKDASTRVSKWFKDRRGHKIDTVEFFMKTQSCVLS